MKKKQKLGRKLLAFLLTLVMVVGMMPGMSMTARADNQFAYTFTATSTSDWWETWMCYLAYNSQGGIDCTKITEIDALVDMENIVDGGWGQVKWQNTSNEGPGQSIEGTPGIRKYTVEHETIPDAAYAIVQIVGSARLLGFVVYAGDDVLNSGGTMDIPELTVPQAITGLKESGSDQALVTPGTAAAGNIEYSLDNNTWSTDVPKAKDKGEYTVYYRLKYGENNSQIYTSLHGAKGIPVTIDEAEQYPLWVGGTQVTSANAADVFSDGTVSYTPATTGDNPTPATLTLNGYTYSGEGHREKEDPDSPLSAIYYSGTDPLTIQLSGTNSITRTGKTSVPSSENAYGIHSTNCNLTIDGNSSGSLTVTGGELKTTYGIYAKTVTIKNADVTAKGIGSSYGAGINGNQGVTIQNAAVNAEGKSDGISCANNGFTEILGNSFVTATGSNKAINKTVKNAIAGTGWTDKEGTEGKVAIAVSTEGQDLSAYKKVQFPAVKEPAAVTKNPEAKTLTYNGSAQKLVTAGTATGGEMQYALGTETEATEDYTTTIPTKTDVGTYYVWYKVIGDANHNDTAPDKVAVTITQADAPEVTAPTLTAVTYDPAKTLADIDLPEGWEWVTDTIVPAVVNNGYEAMCLVDDGNYDYTGVTGYDAQLHVVIRTVPLTVNKADPLSEAVPAELAVCSSDLISVHGTAGQEYIIVLKGTNVTPESWENKTVPDSGNDYLVAFENLSAATGYDVYTRISENANYKAGDAVNTPVCTTIDYTELDFDSDLVGATLTVRPYPENNDYTYKWYRDDRTYYDDDSYQSSLTEIAGVQGNTYTFTADDCGKYIAVKIFVADSEVGDTNFGPIGYGKVLFDSKGGSEVSPVTGLSYGSKVTKPADPEKEGYSFAGWYEDEEYDEEYLWNFDTDTVMWQETTLYAKWVASEKELPYKDVKEIIAKNNGRKPYYYRHLQFLYDHNIMTGLKPDLFGVGAYLTREQAATLLYRYAGSPAVNSDGNPFPDVKKPSHWAYNAIVWAKANGVITGYTAGSDKGMFGPTDDITREQFMVILWRWAKTSGYDITPDSDATYKAVADSNKLSTWAVEAVNWGYEKGIIGNKSLFKPQDNLTREDAATMLHRYIEVVSNLSKA